MAMYQAKGEGRNRIVTFHPIIRYKNDILNTLNYELQIALEDKQFTLLYQPQLNTEMKVIGVEALLRWNHPKKGIIMPDDFLKMAEQGEYIYLLGDYITEMAISQLARWQNNDSTKHLTMSINVSPRQLEKESFVKNLSELILKYKVNPSLVILEITENVLTRDVKNLIQKFYQLRDFGFLLSIDDFGTGYSSLELLFKLPIHQLKIDRTFIMNISEDTQLQIITKTIIGLAKNLNLIVVMEGVETKSQEKWCIDHGCNVLQGFLYAPAISYSEF
jgi:EAL domain-containing protein (putative c-di-GMP-specific phosphodiesterase class I)